MTKPDIRWYTKKPDATHFAISTAQLLDNTETVVKKENGDMEGNDRFGNTFTIIRRNDGSLAKNTQTNRGSDFMFLGNVYSSGILWRNKHVKTYYDEYHHRASLQLDIYGRLLLYFYDEEMNFDGGPDRVDYLWVVVKDEADADEMVGKGKLGRLRAPYIAGSEGSWMAAHEYITEVIA